MRANTAKWLSVGSLQSRLTDMVGCWLLLCKPRIVLLVMVTGLSAMVLEGTLLSEPVRFSGVLVGICLAAGSANALNQFWDRDIDAIMMRTKAKRPLPTGKISPRSALLFGLTSGILGLRMLDTAGNRLAAGLGFGTILFYVCVYTMWLKRKTAWNIVIGGAAGAAPPLIGWASGANELNTVPLLMSLVVFLWTPPHFWALALYRKKEYALAGIPMLPVVAGDRTARMQIALYSASLLPVTAYLGIRADLGQLFFIGTTLLGILFILKSRVLCLRKDDRSAQKLFRYSIFYLTAVFALMLVHGW